MSRITRLLGKCLKVYIYIRKCNLKRDKLMKIKINKIKITGRIRKEVGKIEELAADIRKHGLISPKPTTK